MDYVEVRFFIEPYEEYISDVLAAELGEIGFNSFVPAEKSLDAYAPKNIFDEAKVKSLLSDFPFEASIEYQITQIESKNWNEEWEKHYFEPIVIGSDCVIHSSFHKDVPKAKYDIVIDPKMAFGTGHHETTSLVIGQLLEMNLEGKTVLDMGCGTAVLAILAAMRGASQLLAIDIDTWCTDNSLENIEINKITGIEVKLGGAELLEGLHFDIILANINRNILLADMQQYASCLSAEGELYMSGFYVEDIPLIEAEANRNGLKLIDYKEKNKWVVVKTIKE
ncbi:(LSU ribosomal protein L11P)-lysine N-methyltransferase [Paludibacter propionicigenes WB4]|uniref:Ribosomal protein L11 methyltransferase n=1 Tax=Paludibacter propionicigenes (strain DSM 17365 / JCM 13257 / WB4) TaxID=694427 RepID=E4T1T2_PALPW|nr:50S ribosomal protein L11 methyltransferase [Paludibacter propionicigenes]ADQ78676.1 (LSU ribosomal protein L11P)-lysine N-methyltransferase [Paludibacter propionicigenes WB4]